MNQQKIFVPVIITAVIAGAIGFFGGMKYQQTQRSLTFQQNGRNFGTQGGLRGTSGGMMQAGRGNGFRPVSGEILSSDANSITVKLQDGSSKIVLVSEKTTINKAESATKTDLAVGQTVAVFGSDNSDGSVTAQNIQLNPMLRVGTEKTP